MEEEEGEKEEGEEDGEGGVGVTGFPLFQKVASMVVALVTAVLLRSITKVSWVLNDPPTVFCVTGALGSGWPQSGKKRRAWKWGVAV